MYIEKGASQNKHLGHKLFYVNCHALGTVTQTYKRKVNEDFLKSAWKKPKQIEVNIPLLWLIIIEIDKQVFNETVVILRKPLLAVIILFFLLYLNCIKWPWDWPLEKYNKQQL